MRLDMFLKKVIFVLNIFIKLTIVHARTSLFELQENKGVVLIETTLRTQITNSRIYCAVLCSIEDQCLSSTFDSTAQQCRMYSCVEPETGSSSNETFIQKTVDTGRGTEIPPIDCQYLPGSGVYKIYPKSSSHGVWVYCEDSWTVIQRRIDGFTDFYRDWSMYKYGFGNKCSEHWLGNENIYKITKGGFYSLRIDLTRKDGQIAYAEYNLFRIDSEADMFKLTVGMYSGTAGDALVSYGQVGNSSGQYFYTHDQDNDSDCAVKNRGGWWYKKCTYSNLNGQYNGEYPFSTRWSTFNGNVGMKHVTMKIRSKIQS